MKKFKFTEPALRKLEQEDTPYEVADTTIPGLRCRVRPSGTKSFCIYKRPKNYISPKTGKPQSVRVNICNVGEMPIRSKKGETVETKAHEILALMAKGINPNEAAKQEEQKAIAESMTLQQALDAYIHPDRIAKDGKARTQEQIKQRTADGYKQHIDKHLDDWKELQLRDITPKMVRNRHTKIKARLAANNTMRTLRAIYNHAAEETADANGVSTLPPNPVSGMNRRWTIETRRSNIVDQAELKDWWQATEAITATRPGTKKEVPVYAHGDGELARDYLQFVMLTGLRRREATGLLWENVNWRSKTITILDTKNKDNLELPLSDYLLEILERRKGKNKKYVFPFEEPKKFVAWVREESGVDFTIHDLRRSFITYAESLDIGLLTIKGMVNHRIGGNDVTAGYARITVERMREPMQKITDYVLGHAGKKEDNVVAIGKTKTK